MTFPGRRRESRRIAALILPAALYAMLLGCAPTVIQPLPTAPGKVWQSGELIESLSQRREQFQSLRALARIDYAGPDGKGGVQEAVLVQRPDHLRLETLTMLGAILIVTVNNQEIVGYHPREGVFVRGERSKENLLRYTQIPLELHEMTSLLMGLPPVDPAAPVRQEGGSLIFSVDGRKSDAVAFESESPVPTHWQRFAGSGEIELSAQFTNYVATAAGLFATQIRIEDRRKGKNLEIRYQEPEVNVSIPRGLFSQDKPPHAQEIPIEAIGG